MGPPKAIDTSCCNCNGPILWYREHLPKKLWAHPKPLAAAITSTMGPSYCLGRTCRRSYRPTRSHRQQLLQVKWTHPMALRAPAKKIMGPTESNSHQLLPM